MSKPIDTTEFYEIMDKLFVCCDEHQFTYYCKAHGEKMGCCFCEFNYDEPCGCDE
jgi:hypothetical protein